MKDKELYKLLLNNGWVLDRIKGSHHVLKKDNQTISLPIHGTDMKKNVTIPEWLGRLAEKANINFSQVLQNALKAELNIA